ncbi:hypothetical protein Tco_1555529 [Tanacetum coccineum]
MIASYTVTKIYMDEGSSIDIIYEHYFNKLPECIRSRLRPPITPLISFLGYGLSGHRHNQGMHFMIGPIPNLGRKPRPSQEKQRYMVYVESLADFKYKCFLDAYEGYHQILMKKSDEEKTTFYTNQGLFYYIKMSSDLKNADVTYQTLIDNEFKAQICVNLKAHVDDMAIKRKTEDAL